MGSQLVIDCLFLFLFYSLSPRGASSYGLSIFDFCKENFGATKDTFVIQFQYEKDIFKASKATKSFTKTKSILEYIYLPLYEIFIY